MRWQGLTPKRFLHRGSWLSLCLVAVCLGGARPAWATCGDYLAGHGGPSMSRHDHSQFSAMADRQPGSSEQTPTCSGPQCRQRDPAPAAPSGSVNLTPSSDAMLSSFARWAMNVESGRHPTTAAEHAVTGMIGRPERPPRAA